MLRASAGVDDDDQAKLPISVVRLVEQGEEEATVKGLREVHHQLLLHIPVWKLPSSAMASSGKVC